MCAKKRRPEQVKTDVEDRVPLRLTAAERKLIVEGVTVLAVAYERMIEETAISKPVMFTLYELEDLGRFIAAEANRCHDPAKHQQLVKLIAKIERLLKKHDDGSLLRSSPAATRNANDALELAEQIAEFSAMAILQAQQLQISKQLLKSFWLAPAQRKLLLPVSYLPPAIKTKLQNEKSLTFAEVAMLTLAVAEELHEADAKQQSALLLVANHVIERFVEGVTSSSELPAKQRAKMTASRDQNVVYQFKITLIGTHPPIWRRIQVQDCTLDKLHEHIQTAMGWTNSHMHEFRIRGKIYGDPEFLDDDFESGECLDTTQTKVSDIVPKTKRRFVLHYHYDFGDDWEHELIYEGAQPVEKGQKYPLCVEGERACPPEDIGGVWGFADFLEALADPESERHDEFQAWGPFDPEKFSAKKATREMKLCPPGAREE